MRILYATCLLPLLTFHIAAAQDSTESVSNTTHMRVGWKPEPAKRGTISLVYTCLATIFACTWTVLHLNAPAFDDSAFTVGFRKAKWMAITILFPEFIFVKGISDLRCVLEDLVAFDLALKTNHQDGLERKIVSQSGKLEHTLSWRVRFGSNAKYIYPLLGLDRPPLEPNGNSGIGAEEQKSVAVCISESGGGKQGNDVRTSTEPNIPTLEKIQGSSLGIQIKKHRKEHSTQEESEHRSIAGSQRISGKQHLTEDECNSATPQSSSAESIPHRLHTIQEWTPKHAYLANMGGLVFPTYCAGKDSPKYYPLIGAHLGHNFKWSSDDYHPLKDLVLSKEDIDDKSKADWLLKGFTVLQILWLLMTLLARALQHLPVSQLEIATLAFAVSAIATYVVNWRKPKDIRKPIRLQSTASGTFGDMNPFQLPQRLTVALSGIVEFPERIFSQERMHNDRLLMRGNLPSTLIIGAAANLVFGGLHCLAWNFEFPSRTEQILWRVSSIISTICPAVSASISGYVNCVGTETSLGRSCACLIKTIDLRWGSEQEPWETILSRWGNWCIIGIATIYVVARIVILVLLFTTLRAAPGGVYEVTPWTRYLPSIS